MSEDVYREQKKKQQRVGQHFYHFFFRELTDTKNTKTEQQQETMVHNNPIYRGEGSELYAFLQRDEVYRLISKFAMHHCKFRRISTNFARPYASQHVTTQHVTNCSFFIRLTRPKHDSEVDYYHLLSKRKQNLATTSLIFFRSAPMIKL